MSSDYRCSECGRRFKRDKLTAKLAVFRTLGNQSKQLRSRTTKWLCPSCRNNDPDWMRAERDQSPGAQSTEAARRYMPELPEGVE